MDRRSTGSAGRDGVRPKSRRSDHQGQGFGLASAGRSARTRGKYPGTSGDLRGARMSQWPSTRARSVLAALLRIGWTIKRQSRTSHRVLSRPGWADFTLTLEAGASIPPHVRSGRNGAGGADYARGIRIHDRPQLVGRRGDRRRPVCDQAWHILERSRRGQDLVEATQLC